MAEWLLLAVLVVVLIVVVWWGSGFRAVTVYEYQVGLKYSKGRLTAVLGAGRYWIYGRTTEIRVIDQRPRHVTVGGQEVLSADGVALKVSLAAEFAVRDPETAVAAADDYQAALYLALQFALREIVGGSPIEEVLAARQSFGGRITDMVGPEASELGLELIRVNVRDVMFPGELKKVFAQVVKARQEGLAALERARGESAALRNLSNAARLIEGNPALLQLRVLGTLSESSGNTVVVGLGSNDAGAVLGGSRASSEPDAESDT